MTVLRAARAMMTIVRKDRLIEHPDLADLLVARMIDHVLLALEMTAQLELHVEMMIAQDLREAVIIGQPERQAEMMIAQDLREAVTIDQPERHAEKMTGRERHEALTTDLLEVLAEIVISPVQPERLLRTMIVRLEPRAEMRTQEDRLAKAHQPKGEILHILIDQRNHILIAVKLRIAPQDIRKKPTTDPQRGHLEAALKDHLVSKKLGMIPIARAVDLLIVVKEVRRYFPYLRHQMEKSV